MKPNDSIVRGCGLGLATGFVARVAEPDELPGRGCPGCREVETEVIEGVELETAPEIRDECRGDMVKDTSLLNIEAVIVAVPASTSVTSVKVVKPEISETTLEVVKTEVSPKIVVIIVMPVELPEVKVELVTKEELRVVVATTCAVVTAYVDD